MASKKIPENPNEALTQYQDRLKRYQVSPKVVSGLLSQVKSWHEEGIEVYGFQPPTSPEMRLLEQAKSGFVETDFVKQFEAVGGKWLDIPLRYHSYDGSHLREDAALQLSKDLALKIRARQRG